VITALAVENYRSQRRLLLDLAGDELGYAIGLGLPPPSMSMSGPDPQIKAEPVWPGRCCGRPPCWPGAAPSGAVRIRDAGRRWDQPPGFLTPSGSMPSLTADPQRAPELLPDLIGPLAGLIIASVNPCNHSLLNF
jgi:predicted ATPase